MNAQFNPQNVGTSTITVVNPGGKFSLPGNYQQITATVNP